MRRQRHRGGSTAAWLVASIIASIAASLVSSVAPGAAAPASAAPVSSLTLDGRGWGHGIGLSQWGALGYAVDHGWSAAQILDHYYAGTVAATAPAQVVSVRLTALDGAQTAVVHDRGRAVVAGVAGEWRSLVAREVSPGHYRVWGRRDASVCPGAAADLVATGWTVVANDIAGQVTVQPATDTSASADPTQLLGVCEPSGGRVRAYRGAIRAVDTATGANRTVSLVPLEHYLRSVVGGEVSWGWAAMGNGAGAQALRAQAVAARSYALAERRESWAQTCDNVCQTYRGAGYRTGVGGAFVAQEFAPTDAAVTATAGMVRRVGSTTGPIAYAMYSSSSGGHTAANTLGFTPVPDLGDDVSGNGGHRWSVTIQASAIEQRHPSIGSFIGIVVTSRDGFGEWGGRVLTMRIDGTQGSVTTTGASFRSAFGLKSNWFAPRGASSTPSTPPPPPSTPDPGGVCAGRDAPAATGFTVDSSPTLFTPLTPRRLIDTRVGWGATAAPLGGGCTLVVDPQLDDDASAVVINVTAVNPTHAGYLTAYPCGAARPLASIVPALAGRIVPGTAIVPLDASGRFCVYAMSTTELVIDLSGVYRRGPGDGFTPIVTERRYDSRGGARAPGGQVIRVPLAGIGGVPADARAVALTVHSSDPIADSYVTLWPCDPQRPTTSVLNNTPGASVTNHLQVGLDAGGAVCMYAQHAMHLTLDVSGWFGATGASAYHPVMPRRILDSRDGVGLSGRFEARQNRALTVTGVGGVPATGVRAIAAEVTSTDAASAGYITVHSCLPAVPEVSMVRNLAGNVAATTVTGLVDGGGRWCLMASTAMHVVIDVSGWYAPR